jgi:hypothetical protein
MKIQEQIEQYIASQPEPKRSDMQALHRLILQILPACKLWFFDGKNSENKTVSNPNVGYGFHTMQYADGKTREFYQIGMSANKTGISVYILGIKDKSYLARTYGKTLGKLPFATVNNGSTRVDGRPGCRRRAVPGQASIHESDWTTLQPTFPISQATT